MRRARTTNPISIRSTRGGLPSLNSTTIPSTRPSGQSSLSCSCLSSTSRIRCTSPSFNQQREGDGKEQERKQHDRRRSNVAQRSVRELSQEPAIVHQQQEWNRDEWQNSCVERHRVDRQLHRVETERDDDRRQQDPAGIREREARVL